MGVSTMSVNTKGSAAPSNDGGSGSVPSGFILKLFQMVNGAPDELISVSAKLWNNKNSMLPVENRSALTERMGATKTRTASFLRSKMKSI